MSTRSPAQVRSPGHFLKQLLERRGWTQNDLAEILSRPPRLVSEIVSGKRSITPETAKGLGQAFKTGPDVWMNLEAAYQLHRAGPGDETISRRADIFGRFPVREMQKRGWLPHSASLGDIERHLASFLGVRSLQDNFIPDHAPKRTTEEPSALQAVWLARAKQLAPKLAVGRYSRGALEDAVKDLRASVSRVEDVSKVPNRLAEAGIRFLVIQPLPGSKIDAACMWPNGIPLVAITLRYDRHDIFWHALFHELDHIRHEEGQGDKPIVDTNMMADCSAGVDIEKRANETAAATLIPPLELEALKQKVAHAYSEATVVAFARRLDVHPGIVVGQLQHRGELPWSAFSRLRAKIRHVLVEAAYTDGFGKS
jgi:HTH-type transcriptional regulator / antitoxin HigA